MHRVSSLRSFKSWAIGADRMASSCVCLNIEKSTDSLSGVKARSVPNCST